ncbi:MAG: RelA/SpoT family protein [Candidatus Aminicenantales bacterium]
MIRFNDILEKISSSYSENDITLLQKAYVFAARAHRGQVRRSGEPYLSHPLEVSNMLADMKLDATTIAAGLLHDVLEDTDTTAPDIQEAFGPEITHLVDGVTKISRIEESSPEVRQAESIRKIILAMTDDLRIIFIKLADRIHNLKTLRFLSEDKQKQIARETLEIYAPIANRLGMGRIKAELEDFSFRYVSPEDYFRIISLVEPERKKAERELREMKKSLEQIMKENQIPAEIYYRIKRPYSIYNKMKKRNVDFDQVYDFKALRIITDTVRNCYATLGILHQRWTHLPHRFRDFIAMPKQNLYQALHTTIITEKKQTFEIQIRTKDMHNLAVNGIAAHWKYKDTDSQHIMKEDRRLQWLREMVELYQEQKSPREFLKNLKTDLIPEDVYVFTPKGKVITLPLGSSALDFAFKIHTEIGYHAAKARINGKISPTKTILKTGDIVEIITSEETFPRRDWLNKVFSSSSRHHIKRWLKAQEKKKNIALGKKLWERKSLKHGELRTDILKKKKTLETISALTNFKLSSPEDFFFYLGSGKLLLRKEFMEKILSGEKLRKKKEPLVARVVKKAVKKPSTVIRITVKKDSLANLAKCCSPIKGEPIIGYMTSGKGVTIHSQLCPLVKRELLKRERIVEAAWDPSVKGIFTAKLLIASEDSPGVLAKVASAIAGLGGNISRAEVKTTGDLKAQLKLKLSIKDIQQLEQIIKKITRIKEIFTARRI